MKRNLINASLALTLSAALSACGGGGGSSSDSNPSTGTGGTSPGVTYNLNQMMTSVMTSGKSFTASAISGSDTYQLFLNITPVNDSVFEGAMRKRASQSMTIRKNGATVVATTFDAYYSTNPWQTLGAVYSGGGYLLATTAQPALPASATVGASGSLGTQTLYENSTKSRIVATQQATWTLERATANSANYCVNTVLSDASKAVISSAVGCYLVNNNGDVSAIRWTLAVEGNSLTFQ